MHQPLTNEAKETISALISGAEGKRSLSSVAELLPHAADTIRSAFEASTIEALEAQAGPLLEMLSACDEDNRCTAAAVIASLVELKSSLGYSLVKQSLYDVAAESLNPNVCPDRFAQAQLLFAKAALEVSREGESAYEVPL